MWLYILYVLFVKDSSRIVHLFVSSSVPLRGVSWEVVAPRRWS